MNIWSKIKSNWPQKLILMLALTITTGIFFAMKSDLYRGDMVINVNMRNDADLVSTLDKILPSDAQVISIVNTSDSEKTMVIRLRSNMRKDRLLQYIRSMYEVEDANID